MTGYHPDFTFLERLGVRFEGQDRLPVCNAETLESNVPGIYLAGVIVAGSRTNEIFIENGRFHGGRSRSAGLEIESRDETGGPALTNPIHWSGSEFMCPFRVKGGVLRTHLRNGCTLLDMRSRTLRGSPSMRWWPRSIRWQMLAGLLLLEALSIGAVCRPGWSASRQMKRRANGARRRLAYEAASLALQSGEALVSRSPAGWACR